VGEVCFAADHGAAGSYQCSVQPNADREFGHLGVVLVGGNLPPGLTFPQGLGGAPSITGTPTTVGSYTFTVQATDNTVPQTATVDITIVVDSRVTITKSTLAVGGETHAYSDSFTAVNGTLPLHWSVQSGFPPGLSVNATTGAVTGTPTAGVLTRTPYR